MKKIWTYDKCKEEALKYNTRTEFQKNSYNVYKKFVKYKYINDICSHMIKNNKVNE